MSHIVDVDESIIKDKINEVNSGKQQKMTLFQYTLFYKDSIFSISHSMVMIVLIRTLYFANNMLRIVDYLVAVMI